MSSNTSLYTVLPGRKLLVGRDYVEGGSTVELSKSDAKDFIKLGFIKAYEEVQTEVVEEPVEVFEEPVDRHPLQDTLDEIALNKALESQAPSEPDETVFTPSQPEELTFDSEPVPIEVPVPTVKTGEPEKVNINYASIEEMLKMPVIGPTSAKLIEENRPYASVDIVPEQAKLPKATAGRWEQIKDRFTV